MSKVVAGVIGSCRVHVTLGHAEEAGLIACAKKPPMGYVHNPYEVLQGIEALKGRKRIPSELAHYLTFNPKQPIGQKDFFTQAFADIDLFVVELSSIRAIEFMGWQLQINSTRERLAELGVSKDILSLMHKDTPALNAQLKAFAETEGLTDALRPVIDARFWEMGSEEIRSMLLRIVAALGRPVVFVGIFNNDRQNRPIAQRVILRDQMIGLAKARPDVGFIDPTEFVDHYGYETTLKDLGHYNSEFEPKAGTLLAERVCAFHQALLEAA